MKTLALAVLIALAGCSGGAAPKQPQTPAEGPKEAKHERFIRHPTVVRAGAIRAIFPMSYRDRIEVEGLSAGWREEDGKRIWEGTGKAEVRLDQLILAGPNISVTLVSQSGDPEVLIQADGDVSLGHRRKGMNTERVGKEFILIRNDAWLER